MTEKFEWFGDEDLNQRLRLLRVGFTKLSYTPKGVVRPKTDP